MTFQLRMAPTPSRRRTQRRLRGKQPKPRTSVDLQTDSARLPSVHVPGMLDLNIYWEDLELSLIASVWMDYDDKLEKLPPGYQSREAFADELSFQRFSLFPLPFYAYHSHPLEIDMANDIYDGRGGSMRSDLVWHQFTFDEDDLPSSVSHFPESFSTVLDQLAKGGDVQTLVVQRPADPFRIFSWVRLQGL